MSGGPWRVTARRCTPWLAAPSSAEYPIMILILRQFHLEKHPQTIGVCLLGILFLILGPSSSEARGQDGITSELRRSVQQDSTGGAGILFGRLTRLTAKPEIWSAGAIGPQNDLRLGCPTSKPALAFITLKEKLDLNAHIDRWYPEEKGYTEPHHIGVKELLLNSSGIQDFVPLIPMDPDSAVSVERSIDRAYRHQALLFAAGSGFAYSNTNFNILGRILEIRTRKTIPTLFRQYFGSVAPSIRLDDGKGNYPQGYVRPWPYHWSSPGFAGGFIGTAADALRLFVYIASQPEFLVMTHWRNTDGSYSTSEGEHLLGLGIFGSSDFAGLGRASFYEGDMGPSQMVLARVKGSTFCIYSSHNIGRYQLRLLFEKLIRMSFSPPRQ